MGQKHAIKMTKHVIPLYNISYYARLDRLDRLTRVNRRSRNIYIKIPFREYQNGTSAYNKKNIWYCDYIVAIENYNNM